MKKYIVNITRAGFGNADFVVEADTAAKARKKALVKAYGHSFREHDADYRIDTVALIKKGEEVDVEQ